MTTHIETRNPARADVAFDAGTAATATGRGWAVAGIGAGVAGIGVIVTTSTIGAVYDPDLAGDNDAIAEKLGDLVPNMFVYHSIAVACALLMVVFAAGLYRRLRSALPATSTAPIVAFAGLLGTAVVTVLGSGLDTEFMVTLTGDRDAISSSSATMYNHWIGTIPWVWVLAGLAGLAVSVAGRQGGVPRWVGRVGLVLGGLTVLAGVSPFQYMAILPGAIWLLVTAIGFTVGDKQTR